MGDLDAFSQRIQLLDRLFFSRYSTRPERWFSSPARAEILGCHTGENRGKVLVSAISCDILCAVSPRSDGIAEIASEDFPTISFSVRDLGMREREKGRPIALARGVLRYLKDAGYFFGGFQAVTHSTVFRGAGVSSSAAFGVLVSEIVNRLYLDGVLSPIQKAYAGQHAETTFFGKPCGLTDGCSIAFGGLNQMDFGSETIERLPVPEGYRLVMTNTGGFRGNPVHLADIRREMGEVAAYFGKTVLRELSAEQLQSELPYLRQKVSDRAILRAFHFFEENERVERAAGALKAGDKETFFAQVRKSGESSLGILQNCYVSGEIFQPVVLALKLSERLLKDGAFRMQGGGFGGTVLAFCKEETEREYGAEMARVFGKENVYYTDLRKEGACEWKI